MKYLSEAYSHGADARAVAAEVQDIESLFSALYRQRWLATGVFVVVLGLTLVLTLSQQRLYTTAARMLINHTAPVTWGQSANVPVISDLVSSDGAQTIETYVALMESGGIANEVKENLHLSTTDSAVAKSVKIKPLTSTNVLELSVTWPNPNDSARIANEYARVFTEHERNMAGSRARDASRYLAKALDNAKASLQHAESQAEAFSSKSAIANAGAQTASLISEVSALDQKIAAVQADRQRFQAQLADTDAQLRVESRVLNGQTSVARNPLALQLAQQLQQVDSQLQNARAQYTEEHPVVAALRRQHDTLKRQLASSPQTAVESKVIIANPLYQRLQQDSQQLHAQIFGASAEIRSMLGRRRELTALLSDMPPTARRLDDLQRAVKASEATYNQLKEKYDQAIIAQTVATSDVWLLQPADPTSFTRTPRLTLNLAVGSIIGLACALFAVLLFEVTGSSITTERDVEKTLGLPVLATLPAPPEKQVALRHFATWLTFANPSVMRTITIASPCEVRGKGMIALNTAVALASVEGPVLLVDANFEHPSLHHVLGAHNESGCGFSDVLGKRLPIAYAVQSTALGSLDFLAAGTPSTPADDMTSLRSPEFHSFLEQARERYAAVVFDTSPLDSATSAIALAAQTDATVLVVSTNTKTERAREALGRLAAIPGVNVLGVFLNRAGARVELCLTARPPHRNTALPMPSHPEAT